jgi:hypothetical protein
VIVHKIPQICVHTRNVSYKPLYLNKIKAKIFSFAFVAKIVDVVESHRVLKVFSLKSYLVKGRDKNKDEIF